MSGRRSWFRPTAICRRRKPRMRSPGTIPPGRGIRTSRSAMRRFRRPPNGAKPRRAAEAMVEEGRALRPNELDRGQVRTSTGSVQTPEEIGPADAAVPAWQQWLARILHEQVIECGNGAVHQRAPADSSDGAAGGLPDTVCRPSPMGWDRPEGSSRQAEKPWGSRSRREPVVFAVLIRARPALWA